MTKLYNGKSVKELDALYWKTCNDTTEVSRSISLCAHKEALQTVAEACLPRWRHDDPPLSDRFKLAANRVYVLAIDAKNRMSVGYAYRLSGGSLFWTFAKPIGNPIAWMELPQPPQQGDV